MIVVKVEMWPGGREDQAVEFGRAYLVNKESTTVSTGGARGDYTAKFCGGVYGRSDLLSHVWKSSGVTNFDRTHQGAWHLLFRALLLALKHK